MNRETPEMPAAESAEKLKKFLIIDDYDVVLNHCRRVFQDYPNVTVAECHSLDEARDAIARVQPDVVFLDHNFGQNGGEGMVIAKELIETAPEIKLFTTTSDLEAAESYKVLGISHVDKKTSLGLMNIIDEN